MATQFSIECGPVHIYNLDDWLVAGPERNTHEVMCAE